MFLPERKLDHGRNPYSDSTHHIKFENGTTAANANPEQTKKQEIQRKYQQELQEQMEEKRLKKEADKRRILEEDRLEEQRWKREQEELKRREDEEKQRELNKHKKFQQENVQNLNNVQPKGRQQRQQETGDAQDNQQIENQKKQANNNTESIQEIPQIPLPQISTEASKNYIHSVKGYSAPSKSPKRLDTGFNTNDNGFGVIQKPPDELQNQRILDIYKVQMDSQISKIHEEMNKQNHNLLSQIDYLKKETNNAIRERDCSQQELKSLQGQFKGHLQQNELLKENMQVLLRMNGDQQVNGFLSKYANIEGNGSNQDVDQINTGKFGGGGMGQNSGLNVNEVGSMIGKSKSQPMKLYNRLGSESTEQFNYGTFGNGGNLANGGTQDAQSNFVPLKYLDGNAGVNELTMGKLADMRFSNGDFGVKENSPGLKKYQDDNAMFDSTTKEFEYLLNGTQKARPHTQQNIRASHDNGNLGFGNNLPENYPSHSNVNSGRDLGNNKNGSVFKNLGANMMYGDDLNVYTGDDTLGNGPSNQAYGNQQNKAKYSTYGDMNKNQYTVGNSDKNLHDTEKNNKDTGTNGGIIENDSVLGILEKYGEVKIGGNGLDVQNLPGNGQQFFGNNSKRGHDQNEPKIMQSFGLDEIHKKNELRMEMLEKYEKGITDINDTNNNNKGSNLFDLGGGYKNRESTLKKKNLDFNNKFPDLKLGDSVGVGGGVGGGGSGEYNFGTQDNLLAKYSNM